MRYTTKMLLVPEDVYKELVAAASSRQTNTSLKLEPVDDGEKQLIAQTKKTMKKIMKNRRSNPDVRQIRLMQEFKRYKKLKADLDERPGKVHVDNLDALIEEEKKRENDQAKRSMLKQQISEFSHNLESPVRENWDYDPSIDEGQEYSEAEEAQQDKTPNVNKYLRKKIIPSPNTIRLRSRIKLNAKARPYPDIANAQVPTIARQHLFSGWRKNNDYKDASNFVTPKAFRPQLWSE